MRFSWLLILILGCGLFLPACGEKPFTLDRNYDFLAHLSRAEVLTPGRHFDPIQNPEFELQPWTEDHRIFCPAPAPFELRFRQVPLVPGSRLHLGLTLVPADRHRSVVQATGRIRFQVDLATPTERICLFNETLDADLFKTNKIIEKTISIPDQQVDQGDFYFITECSASPIDFQPVWCGPILRSKGRSRLPEEHPVTFQRPGTPLFASPIPQESDSYLVEHREAEDQFVASENGSVLLQHAPAADSFQADLSGESVLYLGLGLATRPQGDLKRRNVLFQVLVDDQEVYRKVIAGGQGSSRRATIPLAASAAPSSRITLKSSFTGKTEGRHENLNPLWIYPVIEKKAVIPRQRSGDGKNLLLLVVDTLRADHLSCYGYSRTTSPHLDRLADRGVIFTNAQAQSAWTIPSTATILTGKYSYTHGLYDRFHWYLLPGITTLPETLQRAGWTTAAFVANPLITEENNFNAGFEHFYNVPFLTAAQVNTTFVNWLDNHGEEQFFAFLHYMDPHSPYGAPGSFFDRFSEQPLEGEIDPLWTDPCIAEIDTYTCSLDQVPKHGFADGLHPDQQAKLQRLINLYDSEIVYWDHQFGLLLQELEKRGLLEDTQIVVTSDHGEEFLEHSMLRHGQNLHRELLHVPLVFLNTSHPPAKIPDPVGLVDLTPTLVGLALPETREAAVDDTGFDLFKKQASRKFLFAETAHGRRPGRSVLDLEVHRAAFSTAWKGIFNLETGGLALFDLQRDPLETRDVAGTQPVVAESMQTLIAQWVEQCGEEAQYKLSLFDAAALKKLKAMGYVK